MKDRYMLFCMVIQCMDTCTQTWPTIHSQPLLKDSAQVTPQRSPAAEPSDAASVARDDEGRAGHADQMQQVWQEPKEREQQR